MGLYGCWVCVGASTQRTRASAGKLGLYGCWLAKGCWVCTGVELLWALGFIQAACWAAHVFQVDYLRRLGSYLNTARGKTLLPRVAALEPMRHPSNHLRSGSANLIWGLSSKGRRV